MQRFCTEQIEQDRKSDTTLKHSVNFHNKALCFDPRSYFTKLHKQNIIMCAARPKVNRSEVSRGCDRARFCNYYEILLSHVDGWWSTEQTTAEPVPNTHKQWDSWVSYTIIQCGLQWQSGAVCVFACLLHRQKKKQISVIYEYRKRVGRVGTTWNVLGKQLWIYFSENINSDEFSGM